MVLVLAVSIGVNASVFTLVEGVLLRPLPFARPDRLVVVWGDHSRAGGGDRVTLAPATVDDLRRTGVFSGVAAQWTSPVTWSGSGEAEALRAARVDPELFRILGVAPALGRTFGSGAAADGEEAHTAVLSDALWRRRLGADPGAVGRSLILDGERYTVVGVMPRSFRVPLFYRDPGDGAELWLPLTIPPPMAGYDARVLQVVGRLAPELSLDAARGELGATARHLAEVVPKSWDRGTLVAVPLAEQIVGDVRPGLLMLQAAVGLVLLIACANLASLLLARSIERSRDLAVRAMLGADRAALFRVSLAESLLLALLGGGVGILLAGWGGRLLARWAPVGTPRLDGVGLDPGTVAFASALTLFACAVFGLAPAVRALRPRGAGLVGSRGAGGGRGTASRATGRLRDLLVVGQIGLALTLLVGAILLGQSFLRLRAVDPGFRSEHVLTFKLALPPTRYADPGEQSRFFERLLGRIRRLPGVSAAGGITRLPLDTGWGSVPIVVEGGVADGGDPPVVGVRQVTSGYFETLGIGLRAGRGLRTSDDGTSHLVVVVNRTLADRFWPDGRAVGRRLRIGPEGEWREVVGVVADVAYDSLAAGAIPEVFVPHTQIPSDWFQVVVRGEGDPLDLAPEIRRSVRELDPDLPVADVRRLAGQVADSVAGPRFQAFLLSSFAAIALVLAAIGVFGLTSYTVASRTREIGIRMALGARPGTVLTWVLGRSVRLAAIGGALGLVAGALVARSLASRLFGVGALDLPSFLGAALFLGGVCLLASYLPARRAARNDPTDALRSE